MSDSSDDTRTLVFERQMPFPPEKIWRALTDSRLIAGWLMENDFVAEVGHRFAFHATPLPGWSGTTNCEVLTVEEPRLLSYRWGDGSESESHLTTVVTWTLTPHRGGTLVRMEQAGFRLQDVLSYERMGGGWPRILEQLENVVGAAASDVRSTG
jgi:uncharacterized protein YndB with AHSA1/START domain